MKGKGKESYMKVLKKISRLGRALQWFTIIWVVQLLLWSIYVSVFNANGTDALSFTTHFPMLLQTYGWMPLALGICLRMISQPWIPSPSRRSLEPQPGGTY